MRKLLVAVLLFTGFLAHADLASCWIQDAASSGSLIWLLCQQGALLVSDDGGGKWRQVKLPAEGKLRAIELLSGGRGLAVGDGGTVLASEDGGRSWNRVSVPAREHLSAIHFVGERGWIAGWGGTILHSSDGGRSWVRQLTPVPYSLEAIYFVDERHGWAVGWTGAILRTTDGGQTWEPVRSTAASWSLSAVYFRDVNEGWAAGFGGQILHTTDGGRTWETQPSPVRDWLTSIQFDRTGRGWITTSNGFLVSEDGGRTWKQIRLEQPVFLRRVIEAGGSLWAIGPFGVLKQEPATLAWQSVELRTTPEPAAGQVTATS
ncbi:MAG: YCF48-related protein [Bryobacterales bacterium]|nr:YCF48-related protein [Bryobacteraceae bacterium]MDW8129633.1 YCF48-related protein [Bryobacterales bacterium]